MFASEDRYIVSGHAEGWDLEKYAETLEEAQGTIDEYRGNDDVHTIAVWDRTNQTFELVQGTDVDCVITDIRKTLEGAQDGWSQGNVMSVLEGEAGGGIVFANHTPRRTIPGLIAKIDAGESVTDTERLEVIQHILAFSARDWSQDGELDALYEAALHKLREPEEDEEDEEDSEDTDDDPQGGITNEVAQREFAALIEKIDTGETVTDTERLEVVKNIIAFSERDWTQDRQEWALFMVAFHRKKKTADDAAGEDGDDTPITTIELPEGDRDDAILEFCTQTLGSDLGRLSTCRLEDLLQMDEATPPQKEAYIRGLFYMADNMRAHGKIFMPESLYGIYNMVAQSQDVTLEKIVAVIMYRRIQGETLEARQYLYMGAA